jgi:hypothetical protein
MEGAAKPLFMGELAHPHVCKSTTSLLERQYTATDKFANALVFIDVRNGRQPPPLRSGGQLARVLVMLSWYAALAGNRGKMWLSGGPAPAPVPGCNAITI